jgi:hypothetical protein
MENPKGEGLAKTLEAPEGSVRLVYSKEKSELDKSE